MTDEKNKDIVTVLKHIEKLLTEIKYDLTDIKREMPKVPYYGDLLQDIIVSVSNLKNRWLYENLKVDS